jgi:hypothetical protein
MADFDGTPVLQPMEWFAQEIISESFEEDAEIIVLERTVEMLTFEKNKRLFKE